MINPLKIIEVPICFVSSLSSKASSGGTSPGLCHHQRLALGSTDLGSPASGVGPADGPKHHVVPRDGKSPVKRSKHGDFIWEYRGKWCDMVIFFGIKCFFFNGKWCYLVVEGGLVGASWSYESGGLFSELVGATNRVHRYPNNSTTWCQYCDGIWVNVEY